MIDTVKLRSPALSEQDAAYVRECLELKSCLHLGTGELMYSITAGHVEDPENGHSINVRLMYEEYSYDKGERISLECPPYLIIEGSVHKALMGHNVEGGPLDPRAACRWLVHDVARRCGAWFPDGDLWEMRRVDQAECFDMGSAEGVREYIHGLAACSYPRRQVRRIGDESIYAAGRSTSVILYHKGPAFFKQDKKRLVVKVGYFDAQALQLRANAILRVEVAVKAKKLDDDFGHVPRVSEITQEYCQGVYVVEGRRFLREGQSDMETVRNIRDVRRRLYAVYGSRLAKSLLGFWGELSMLGEDVVKESSVIPTFYRQRKKLVDAGISWHGTDVMVRDNLSAIPFGFAPVLSDSRRIVMESHEVREKIRPFRIAA